MKSINNNLHTGIYEKQSKKVAIGEERLNKEEKKFNINFKPNNIITKIKDKILSFLEKLRKRRKKFLPANQPVKKKKSIMRLYAARLLAVIKSFINRFKLALETRVKQRRGQRALVLSDPDQVARRKLIKHRIILIITALLIVAIGVGCAWFVIWLNVQNAPVNKEYKGFITLEVKNNESLQEIASDLENKNIIKDDEAFLTLVNMEGYTHKFKPALYAVSPAMDSKQIMEKLSTGISESMTFVIYDGKTIDEIAEQLDYENVISKEDFLYEAEHGYFDYPFIDKAQAGKNRLEGFFMEGTYTLAMGSSAHHIIDTILSEFNKVYEHYNHGKTEYMGYSAKDVITLASIVQKETYAVEEMSTIASVFYNRLKNDMPLQTDATIHYALGYTKSRLTYDDLKIESPYNTYTNKGLPPGPICSPGKDALNAALNPADTDYLFFVATGFKDGTHAFSVTYDAFLRNKQKYLNRMY